MSSDGSSTLSKIRQFGLYRTVDARTEEFLKLSRRRQIKQGCACAAVSTAVTVTIVIVILLIYEYAIAVESSQVQTNRYLTNNSNVNITEDHPIADRLDRSYFGFDQEAFERMPLLVNAMQENSYVDPAIELPIPDNHKKGKYINLNTNNGYVYDSKYKPIRRTSPRPFIFEYRSPTPTPFANTHNYSSRGWIESYRNAQRLKNMEQVLKYLEKTINAKFADLYTLPSTRIAFSGLYVPPKIEVKPEATSTSTTTTALPELIAQASNINIRRKPTYSADPLFTFKPESPGDVNLLADQSLRFSPNPIQNIQKVNRPENKRLFKIPMFRPIPQFKHGCLGTRCGLQHGLDKKILQVLQGTTESERKIEKPKSFSVMLNLFPMQQKRQDYFPNTNPILDKIYFTTIRPKLQFRPKPSALNNRPSYHRYKRPRVLVENKSFSNTKFESTPSGKMGSESGYSTEPTNMVLHVNVFPKSTLKLPKTTTTSPSTTTDIETTSFEVLKNNILTTNPPIRSVEIIKNVNQVAVTITPNSLPTVTTTYPFYESDSQHFKVWTTNQPEILKFSHEDARVPDQYLQFGDRFPTTTDTVHIRRHSTELIDTIDPSKVEHSPSNEDMRALIVELKNRLETTTSIEELLPETVETTDKPTTTTSQTYVPQINGHYRSLNQNSRNINNWLNGESDKKLSRRLQLSSVTVTRKPYVEIQRKSSSKSMEESDIFE